MKYVTIYGNAQSITMPHPQTYCKNLTLRYPIFCPFNGKKLKITLDNFLIDEEISIDYVSIGIGDSLSDKLLTNKISDELLESVQNAIYEIEKINEKYKKINNINEKIEKLYQEKLGIMKNQTKKEEKKEFNINYKYGNDQKNFFYKISRGLKNFKIFVVVNVVVKIIFFEL